MPASEAGLAQRLIRSRPWRAVEHQHQIATARLVDSLDDQALLEEALDAAKPPVPEEARHLHYLAFTPFRYRPAWPSRFRAAHTRGQWYGAAAIETALVEQAHHRHRFWADSEADPPEAPLLLTCFRGRLRTRHGLDLTAEPLSGRRREWLCEPPYAGTIALGDAAQSEGVAVIRYESLREIQYRQRPGMACYAVLSPAAFEAGGVEAGSERNMQMLIRPGRVSVLAATGGLRLDLRMA